jgi:hypothetical protein
LAVLQLTFGSVPQREKQAMPGSILVRRVVAMMYAMSELGDVYA